MRPIRIQFGCGEIAKAVDRGIVGQTMEEVAAEREMVTRGA